MQDKRRGSKPDISVSHICSKCNTPYTTKASWREAIEIGKIVLPEGWKVINNQLLCPKCHEQKL